jgi:hypothetical protein
VADQDKILGGLNFTAGSTFIFNLCPVSNTSFLSFDNQTFIEAQGRLVSSSFSLSLYFSSFLHLFFSLILPVFLLCTSCSGLKPPPYDPPLAMPSTVSTSNQRCDLAATRGEGHHHLSPSSVTIRFPGDCNLQPLKGSPCLVHQIGG